ncbi:Oxoglutarate and iron-dependent oxygenase degradation C-term-domain-containing protein [Delphinella strobiligena]|nr:Oxoglutarate and iron-dependent oxygenase degradation C-term-domain-containing protein [Delphinella strobiligena]
MVKRKHGSNGAEVKGSTKKAAIGKDSKVHDNFRTNLFEAAVLKGYRNEYAESAPYKHAVITELINDELLRNVRKEIIENVHFTPKETDIYKIHQSGDLANLSGLPESALKLFPSLLTLRDSLYSADFRAWISEVSGAGPLSGKKTDMAVNVYAPGCHLLCHDDVIGSRRVSYILYLTHPDKPWQASWGGALRLYPTDDKKDSQGKKFKVPKPEWNKVIPPAWNQLSFFAVQPGESFHDVEEVYKRSEGESGEDVDGGRIRMAISGWFHIPQEGEEGYEEGLEESLAEKSSLQQLQGKNDEFDLPKDQWIDHDGIEKREEEPKAEAEEEDVELTEQDLEFLLKFMTPHYLTPDTVDELSGLFADESSLQLANFLSKKFSAKLKDEITAMDKESKQSQKWQTAAPPHKHRYLFRQPPVTPTQNGASNGNEGESAYDSLLNSLLPSLAFRKWLALATGLTLNKSAILARRFRRGLDYTLATGYEKENVQIEYCLNVTPSKGWGTDAEEVHEEEEEEEEEATNSKKETEKGKGKATKELQPENEEEDDVGGYEIYMAGDDDDDDGATDAGSDHGVEIPPNAASATGGGNRRQVRQKRKADPAIYQASGEDEDDGILFSNPAGWNTLSIVLRDHGVLKFVKFVSQAAKGDRWDFVGQVEVEDDDDDGEGVEEEDGDAMQEGDEDEANEEEE